MQLVAGRSAGQARSSGGTFERAQELEVELLGQVLEWELELLLALRVEWRGRTFL